jgi:hypothetical protein
MTYLIKRLFGFNLFKELDNHQKLLFLLDDLFINITITQSLPWNPEDPINFIKFYEDRRFSTLECIIKRIN